MDSISLEDFLKQPKEVQKIIQKYLYGNRNILPIETTETELRKFIEDKMGGKLFNWFDGVDTHLYIGYFDEDGIYNTKKLLQTNESDLLQAYWQGVCKIAEGIKFP